MDKVEITVSLEKEQMVALEIFLKSQNTTPKKKLAEALQEIYEQTVPQQIRDFIEAKAKASSHPRHAVKPHAPEQDAEHLKPEADSTSQEAGDEDDVDEGGDHDGRS